MSIIAQLLIVDALARMYRYLRFIFIYLHYYKTCARFAVSFGEQTHTYSE